MARMIPEVISDTANDTERRVFHALRRHLPDDCIVWYELPLERRGRSVLPDLVLIGPHVGLVALEVKGWRIDQIAPLVAPADASAGMKLWPKHGERKPAA